jgi:hypothetical protein
MKQYHLHLPKSSQVEKMDDDIQLPLFTSCLQKWQQKLPTFSAPDYSISITTLSKPTKSDITV